MNREELPFYMFESLLAVNNAWFFGPMHSGDTNAWGAFLVAYWLV